MSDSPQADDATVETVTVATKTVRPGQSILAPHAGYYGSPVAARKVLEVFPAFGFSQGARFRFEDGDQWTTGLPHVSLIVEP